MIEEAFNWMKHKERKGHDGELKMLATALVVTTDFSHPLIARVHHLVRFLRSKGIEVKVIDIPIPFGASEKGLASYLKDVLTFWKSGVLNSRGSVVHFPLLSLKTEGNLRSLMSALGLAQALILAKIGLRTRMYDIVITTGPIAGFVTMFFAEPETYVIYEDTDFWGGLSKGKLQSFVVSLLENYCLKKAGLVISNSKFLTERSRTFNPRTIFISNGVDVARFYGQRKLSPNPTLVYMGSISEWAGLDIVLEAMPQLIKKFQGITLKVCGDGPKRPEYERYIKDKGLEEHVLFLGKLPYAELPNQLLSSHVGVAMFRPQRFSFFASPLKLFEYMAAGLPIVATDIGETSRIIKESKSGLSVSWTPTDFAKAVGKLLGDKNFWRKCHSNGLRYARKYDWYNLFEKWLQNVETHRQAFADEVPKPLECSVSG